MDEHSELIDNKYSKKQLGLGFIGIGCGLCACLSYFLILMYGILYGFGYFNLWLFNDVLTHNYHTYNLWLGLIMYPMIGGALVASYIIAIFLIFMTISMIITIPCAIIFYIIEKTVGKIIQ